MSRKFSEGERYLLNQFIITCELRHLTEYESLTYIKKKLGKSISRRMFYQIKKTLYEQDILRKSSGLRIMGEKPLLPEVSYLNLGNEASQKYRNVNDLDFTPEHLYKLF